MSDLRKPVNVLASGERQGSATAVQLPNIKGSMVYIKAVGSNAGNVYVGRSGVTVVNGTTDTTSGIELDAGEMLGPDRKSTRLNSSHSQISYAVFCLKKK